MKEQKSLSDKLRDLKQGEHFVVSSETERQAALRLVKAWKKIGAFELQIVTRKDGNQWKVAAI